MAAIPMSIWLLSDGVIPKRKDTHIFRKFTESYVHVCFNWDFNTKLSNFFHF